MGGNRSFVDGVGEQEVEKGFRLAVRLLVEEVVPKSLAPKSSFGVRSSCSFDPGPRSCCANRGGISSFRTARIARTLPAFLLHAFLGHPNMYKRLSSFGKCSGRSPCSCNKSSIGLPQALQFAKLPGGVFSSSQVGHPPRWLIVSSVGSLEGNPSNTPVSV